MKRTFCSISVFNFPKLWVVGSIFAAAGMLAGCGGKSAVSQDEPAQEAAGPQFSPKNGLLLPEETRKSLGLKIVEVEEQKVESVLDMQFRVYEASAEKAVASSLIAREDAQRLQRGQELEIRREDNAIAAKVARISDPFEKTSGLVEVLIEITNPPDWITSGRFIDARAKFGASENVVTIPRDALLECSEGYFVYASSGDAFVRTAVKVGSSNDEVVEIKDGLYSGDLIALTPVMSLWMTELAAIKGGQACCLAPAKGK